MPMHQSTPHLPPAIPAQRRSSAMRPTPAIPAQRGPAHRLAVPEVPAPRPASAPVIPTPRQPVGGRPIVPRQHAPAAVRTTARRPVAQAPRPTSAARPAPEPATAVARTSRAAAVLDVVGQMGSGVMLSALLVVAAAVGGLADGHPSDAAPLTITFDGGR
jgi:hypothetical protein